MTPELFKDEDGHWLKSDGKGGYVAAEAPKESAPVSAPAPTVDPLEEERVKLGIPDGAGDSGYTAYRQGTNTYLLGQGDRIRGFGDYIDGKIGIGPEVSLDDATSRQRLISDYLAKKYAVQNGVGTAVGILAPGGIAGKLGTGAAKTVETALPALPGVVGRAATWLAPRVAGGAATGGLVEGSNAVGRGNSAEEVARKTSQGMLVGGATAPLLSGVVEGVGKAGGWVADKVAAPVIARIKAAMGTQREASERELAGLTPGYVTNSSTTRQSLMDELKQLRDQYAFLKNSRDPVDPHVLEGLRQDIRNFSENFEDILDSRVSDLNKYADPLWERANKAGLEAESKLSNLKKAAEEDPELQFGVLGKALGRFNPKEHVGRALVTGLLGAGVGDKVVDTVNSGMSGVGGSEAPQVKHSTGTNLVAGAASGALLGALGDAAVSGVANRGNAYAGSKWIAETASKLLENNPAMGARLSSTVADYLAEKYGPGNQTKGDFLESQRNAGYRAGKAQTDWDTAHPRSESVPNLQD
jgi:hypothetical protein